MADDDDTPWAEKHWLEKVWIVFGNIVRGVIALGLVAVLLAAAVNETRWTFTRVSTERVCSGARHVNCLTRTPGIVQSSDETGFTIAIDRAPYRRTITSLHGPAPPVGTRLITEDWHGRLVSVVDPARGRVHTDQWPKPWKDALEALAAWAALLFIPVLVAVIRILDWNGRRKAGAGGSLLVGQNAQPS